MKLHSFDTALVRLVALLLITNSHLDTLYPDARFATGGALGNSLFFAISGFGLVLSAQKGLPDFFVWIGRRLFKIYPQVFIVTIVGWLFFSDIFLNSLSQIVHFYIWPTNYWFVAAIAIFYLPFYFFLRVFPTRFAYGVLLCLIPYFWVYFTVLDLGRFSIEDDPFRWLFYFPMMLFGAYLATSSTLRNYENTDVFALAFIFLAYMVLKVAFSNGLLLQYQFTIHLLTFPFVYYSMRLFAGPFFSRVLDRVGLYTVVGLLGGLSLEVYLVQGFVIKWLAAADIDFFARFALVWPLVFIVAWPVSFVCKKLVGGIGDLPSFSKIVEGFVVQRKGKK